MKCRSSAGVWRRAGALLVALAFAWTAAGMVDAPPLYAEGPDLTECAEFEDPKTADAEAGSGDMAADGYLPAHHEGPVAASTTGISGCAHHPTSAPLRYASARGPPAA